MCAMTTKKNMQLIDETYLGHSIIYYYNGGYNSVDYITDKNITHHTSS